MYSKYWNFTAQARKMTVIIKTEFLHSVLVYVTVEQFDPNLLTRSFIQNSPYEYFISNIEL